MIAIQYAKDVTSNKIIACKWVKLACQRFLNDLKNGYKRGLTYDEEAVERVLKFFTLLKYTKGEWAGNTFEPSPWQVFCLANLFGWKREDGTRRFRNGYLEVARKAGKTELMAGIGLYLFAADKEYGAEVYSVATKKDQARISHKSATMMVRMSKPLREKISIYKNNLNIEDMGNKFEPLGADSKTMDGLGPHGVMIDELHAHPNRDVYDVMVTGTGARRQPLVFSITTAGYDKQSICWEQHDYTEKVLEGIIKDDSHFGMIFTLDEGDDWEDEKVWVKSNPNLGVCTKIDDLRDKARKAKEVATQLNAFLRLHMNVWTESVTRWISSDKWNECQADYTEEDLVGMTCCGGLDLATTTDISALILIFEPEREGGKYRILTRFWIPRDNIQDRVRRDRVPYDTWERQGFITATTGNIIDYGFIINRLSEDAQKFDIREVAFDRWGATKIIQDLQEMGFEEESNKHAQRHLIQFGQGFASMSAPTKALEKMILAKEIEHDGNPVLAWMVSNTVIKQDAADNWKPDKQKSTEKIDGVVATIMALDRVTRFEGSSVYEERGILVL